MEVTIELLFVICLKFFVAGRKARAASELKGGDGL
jgi:hypothetical protein